MRYKGVGLAFLVLVLLASCVQGPLIQSFTASSDAITKGDSVQLSWSASNYDTLTLTPSVGDVTGRTSVTVSPTETTVYTLTASKGAAKESRSLEIRVGEAPVIRNFAASISPVAPGGTTQLSWIVENADTLRIDPEPGDVTGQTSTTVTVRQDTTYTLTATNAFGSTQASVEVKVGLGPTIEFTAEPEKLPEPGGESTLRWNVTGEGTLKVSINRGVGSGLAAKGSKTVNVSTTTTYTLTASDDRGTRNATVTVMVGAKPTVTLSSPTPMPIDPGDGATLRWSAEGPEITSVTITPGVGEVAASAGSGSVTVYPAETTTYTITATSPYGVAEPKSVTVRVRPPLPEGNITLLIAGQSNAVGQGELDNPEPSDPHVRMLGNDYLWKTAYEPVDDNTNQIDLVSKDDNPGHSFGVRLGKTLYNETGKDVYLIPAARGGSCLQNPCSSPIWKPLGATDRSTLYGSAVYRARVSDGRANNPPNNAQPEGGEVTGIIWYQGESDSYSDDRGDNFIANTNEVMDRFKQDIAPVPIIYVQLAARLNDTARSPYYQNNRERQRQMETTYGVSGTRRDAFYMVVAHDLPMIDDNHLSAAGQKELGDRIALAYLEHVLGFEVDGTGPRLISITQEDETHIKVTTTRTLTEDQGDTDYAGYFVVYNDKVPVPKSQIEVERHPTDPQAIQITIPAGLTGTLSVSYGPPTGRPKGRIDNVVRDAESGLPLPAFGFTTNEPGLVLEHGLPVGFETDR